MSDRRNVRARTASGALPLVIAHRGGAGEAPENTMAAVHTALDAGADLLWLSVQFSADRVPVLHRPSRLEELTDGTGTVGEHTARALTRLDAARHFRHPNGTVPYPPHDPLTALPTLEAALRALPPYLPVVLDLKSPTRPAPAGGPPPLTSLLDRLAGEGVPTWSRLLFYSTRDADLHALRAHPDARTFEPRGTTRTRLLRARLSGGFPHPPAPGTWAGFELRRDLVVGECCALGPGSGKVPDAMLWDRPTVDGFHECPDVTVVFFDIDTREDFATAAALGADAVLTDVPAAMTAYRSALAASPVRDSAPTVTVR
ncbi:glycerophosphodiester phosphodiesterase family protein [Kitasatospora sp. NPDC089509]|uniref:glycerophosphodiester phosphodiesterase family protein n=1 Tax=Kitasatospora sp. NPDC089509 TaxID=3364079 RepID=UPI0037F5B56E